MTYCNHCRMASPVSVGLRIRQLLLMMMMTIIMKISFCHGYRQPGRFSASLIISSILLELNLLLVADDGQFKQDRSCSILHIDQTDFLSSWIPQILVKIKCEISAFFAFWQTKHSFFNSCNIVICTCVN